MFRLIKFISKFKDYGREYGFTKAMRKSFEKIHERLKLEKESFKSKYTDQIGSLKFQCNICGKICAARISELTRENPSCPGCGSTVRMRAMIHALSTELFGKSLVISEFPANPDLTGIGMSDWEVYSLLLSQKLDYKNTYYHKEPKLDITSIDLRLEGTLDFLISSDVLEHVLPPVSRAFENARKLLKPGGVFIFSVPYVRDGKTKEHFPDLYKYEIVKRNGDRILRNITKEGVEQIFGNLVFHGGDGSTLEMRYFSESSLMEEFEKAGFKNVKIYNEPDFEHGIYWNIDWSLPIAARPR